MWDVASILGQLGLLEDAVFSAEDIDIKIHCPFHEESRPSLNINLASGLFYCFGCGRKGDIIDIVSKIKRVNRLKAMLLVAENFSGDKEVFKRTKVQRRNWLEEAKIELEQALLPDWFHLQDHYLIKERRLKPEVLKKFGVRVDPFAMHYPIVFPLAQNRKFRGIMRRAEDNEHDPSYLYNKGFRRNNVLVGRYRKKRKILVCEGWIDGLTAFQYGFVDFCCLLGWKISQYQVNRLQHYTDTVISALDNTETGERGTQLLRKYFNVVRFPFPERRKDLNEMTELEFNYARRTLNV